MASIITNDFTNQEIVANVLVRKTRVNGSGYLTIPAPAGINVNDGNGTVRPTLTITQVGDPILTSTTILRDKIVNNGLIIANVSANNAPVPSLQDIQIPWQDIIDTPGVSPEATVRISDFVVNGFTYTGVVILGIAYIIITVVYEYCVAISEPKVLSVNASEGYNC